MTYIYKRYTKSTFVPKAEPKLPEDYTNNIDEFPEDVQLYLEERGISPSLAEQYDLGYSESIDRLILPNYGCIGQLLGWQGRSMTSKQEYVGEGEKPPFYSHSDQLSPVIIVESQICAMRVGQYTQAVALLGNHLNDENLLELGLLSPEYYCLWLDKDRGGYYGIINLFKRLSNYGRVILHTTTKDPKWLSEDELKEELGKIYDKGRISS